MASGWRRREGAKDRCLGCLGCLANLHMEGLPQPPPPGPPRHPDPHTPPATPSATPSAYPSSTSSPLRHLRLACTHHPKHLCGTWGRGTRSAPNIPSVLHGIIPNIQNIPNTCPASGAAQDGGTPAPSPHSHCRVAPAATRAAHRTLASTRRHGSLRARAWCRRSSEA